MANEIQFPYPQTGLTTLTAVLYLSGDPTAGLFGFGPISLSDTNSPGVYWGSVPTATPVAAGVYTIVVYDGSNIVGNGVLQWDGTQEVKGSDLALQSTALNIKAKTDSLTFTVAGVVDSNIQYVNDVQVKGTGLEADPWNPV